jgi:hypothetical protein
MRLLGKVAVITGAASGMRLSEPANWPLAAWPLCPQSGK